MAPHGGAVLSLTRKANTKQKWPLGCSNLLPDKKISHFKAVVQILPLTHAHWSGATRESEKITFNSEFVI